jgi:hypothetical protein
VSALPERPVRVLDIGGRLGRVMLDARPLLRELVVLNPYASKRSALARLAEDCRVEVIDAWTALDPIPTTPRFDLVLWRHWCPAHARVALLADAVTQLVPRGTLIDHVSVADPLIDGLLGAVFANPMMPQLGVDLDVELTGLRDTGLVDLERGWSDPGSALVVGQAPGADAWGEIVGPAADRRN